MATGAKAGAAGFGGAETGVEAGGVAVGDATGAGDFGLVGVAAGEVAGAVAAGVAGLFVGAAEGDWPPTPATTMQINATTIAPFLSIASL